MPAASTIARPEAPARRSAFAKAVMSTARPPVFRFGEQSIHPPFAPQRFSGAVFPSRPHLLSLAATSRRADGRNIPTDAGAAQPHGGRYRRQRRDGAHGLAGGE